VQYRFIGHPLCAIVINIFREARQVNNTKIGELRDGQLWAARLNNQKPVQMKIPKGKSYFFSSTPPGGFMCVDPHGGRTLS